MKTERVFSDAPWEAEVGYCRAIRMGQQVAVTGTVSVGEDGKVFAAGKAYEQAKRCLQTIEKSLAQLNVKKQQILRTRMFVTDIRLWREFGRAHAEFFKDHPPATTMVEVQALISPEFLIEIEADAVVA